MAETACLPSNPTPIGACPNENYVAEPRTQNLKEQAQASSECKEFKEDTNTSLDFEENKKHRSNVQENTNTQLKEMTKVIQDLKTEFNKEVKTPERTQEKGRWKRKHPD